MGALLPKNVGQGTADTNVHEDMTNDPVVLQLHPFLSGINLRWLGLQRITQLILLEEESDNLSAPD